MSKSSNLSLSWVMRGRTDRTLIAATKQASQQIENVKRAADKLNARFSGLAGPAQKFKKTLLTGLAGIAPALLLIAKNTAESGNNFDKMSQKSGLSAQTLSQWCHAANMSCVSTDTFRTNLLKLNQQIALAASGNKNAELAFKRAGVSIRDSAGKLKSADQIMLEMSDTFKKMPEGVYKSSLAVAVFGKSGADMIPLLQNGSTAIKNLIQQSDELGVTFSQADAAASAEFCDNLDLLKKSIIGVKNTIGKQLIPIISPLLKSFAQWISANRELIATKFADWLNQLKSSLPEIKKFLAGVFSGISSFAAGVDTAVSAMGGWLPVLKRATAFIVTLQAIKFAKWIHSTATAALVLGKSFRALIPIVIKFGLALMANPIGMIITAIGLLIGAGYALYKNWDKVVGFLKNMWSGLKTFFSEKFDSIKSLFDDGFINGILNLCKKFNPVSWIMGAIDGIFKYFTGVSLIDEGKKFIQSFADGIVNTWKSIKKYVIDTFTGWIPDWLKSGFKKTGIDVDLIRRDAGIDDNVDAHHANGAIVRQRQIAEIGEDGPEAIIPLTKPARGKKLLIESARIMGLNLNNQNQGNKFGQLVGELSSRTPGGSSTSFSPTFSPTITVNSNASDDDLIKKLHQLIASERVEFEKQFNNYLYQRKRIGVF